MCQHARVLRVAGALQDLAFSRGLRRPVRVPGVSVVSVGALTIGGAGKTPVTLAIAERVRDGGWPVAVVLRGYGGTGSAPGVLVSDGTRLGADVARAGDEAVLHARRLPGVLVRIGADRVEAVRRAGADGARLVVLDDGFQHRRLARDLDVVCLGAEGLRREGDAALARADVVLAIDRDAPPGLRGRVLPARTVATALVRGPELTPVGQPSALAGARVALACAIAHPERFVRVVQDLGATVVALRARRDHGRLSGEDLSCPRGADLLLVTEKDLVKLEDDFLGLRVEIRDGFLAAGPLRDLLWSGAK
jgi:tetraacyldisaccharide 4'-kinase